MKRILFTVLTLCLFAATALAQSTSGVTGVVRDPSGLAVAGVDVKLTDTKTAQELTTQTNDQGVYSFNKVAPGQAYTLTFSAAGFETLVLNNVSLGVATTETYSVELKIGQISTTVNVTADAGATLNTTDASIGNVIDERRLRELPIQIRNSPAALIGLQPGVVGNNVGTATTNRVGSVTGSRADQGNITVDGIDANDQATGQFASTVGNAPIDAIQEFKTVTTNPTAAEGRSSGGQVELVTKSGSNEFHGNVREYNRTAATAANTFFNNKNGIERPQLTRNQFGGSIGGPIKRDKVFFFFDYEGRRDAQGVSYLRIVPLEHFRNGGLAYINNTAGCTASSRLSTDPQCVTVLTPAQVAALDPRGVGASPAFLNFIRERYPAPNDLSAGNGVNTGGFRFNSPSHRTDNTYTTRIDWNPTEKQRVFGRFNIARRLQTDTVNTVAQQFPGDPESGQIVVRDYAWAIGHNWVLTPNVVNQATVGVSRSGLLFPAPFQPSFPNVYGAPAAVSGGTIGGTNFGIAAPFADISEQDRFVLTPTIRDDLTWIKGSHSLALGGSFKPIDSKSGLVNDFNFVSLGLGGGLSGLNEDLRPANIRPDTSTNTSVSSTYDAAFAFLLGRFASIQTNFVYDVAGTASDPGTGKNRDFKYNEYEFYAQDNWRARNDLTLTFGIRWQYYPAPYEANGFQACNDVDFRNIFDIRQRNAATGLLGFDASLAAEPLLRYDLCGKANNARPYYEPDLNNFAPRAAFAWNPEFKSGLLGKIFGDRKTVIRGGGSVVYDRTAGALTFIQDQLSYLFDNAATTNFGLSGDPSLALLTDPRFTGINQLPIQNTAPSVTRPVTPFVEGGIPVGNAQGQFNYAIDQQFKTPYSIQYSLGFQREIPGNFILETAFVGRQGRQLFSQADAAQILDYLDPASGQRLLTAFNSLQRQVQAGTPGSGLTPQPFFESQITSALRGLLGPSATCQNSSPLFGLPAGFNCTRLLTAFTRSLVSIGDVSDTFQAAYQLGLMNPNVGLPGQFSSNVFISNLAASNYNGMLVSLRKRMSNGLQFDVNYTLSHAIDNQSSVANTVTGGLICDLTNLRVCRGNSDFDIRHLFNANWIYELPFGKGRWIGGNSHGWVNQIIGGWTWSGIFAARSGLPFSTTTGSFPTSFIFNSPAVLTGSGAALQGQIHDAPGGTIQFFADPATARAEFRNPFGGEIGGRNILRGPGFWNVDMALLKNFQMPWSENHRLQIRWETYNTFNHHSFGLPNANFASGSFGQITTSASTPREMQFAIRYEF
jgi:hypothetical protein